MQNKPVVIAAALGECVHVAASRFPAVGRTGRLATVFLGPAVAPEQLIQAAQEHHAQLVGVSYRLTPENGAALLAEFAESADDLRQAGVRFAFGGTPPVAERPQPGRLLRRRLRRLRAGRGSAGLPAGQRRADVAAPPPATLLERLAWKAPYPLLRHHFGLPSLEATRGIAELRMRASSMSSRWASTRMRRRTSSTLSARIRDAAARGRAGAQRR